jgi:hypothetical protein
MDIILHLLSLQAFVSLISLSSLRTGLSQSGVKLWLRTCCQAGAESQPGTGNTGTFHSIVFYVISDDAAPQCCTGIVQQIRIQRCQWVASWELSWKVDINEVIEQDRLVTRSLSCGQIAPKPKGVFFHYICSCIRNTVQCTYIPGKYLAW